MSAIQGFQHCMKGAADMAGTATSDGRFEWTNPRFKEHLGWNLSEIRRQRFIDLVHPEDVAQTLHATATIQTASTPVTFTNRYRHKSNGWRWCEWRAHHVPDDLDRICFIVQDVTEQKAEEARKRRRMAQLALAERLHGAGHWTLDLKSGDVRWSQEIYRIHGRDPGLWSPTIKSCVDAYHPDDQELARTYLDRCIRYQEPFDDTMRKLRSNGEVCKVHVVGRPELNAFGEVVGVYGILRDITKATQRIRPAETDELAFMVAHDLKQPIRTLHSYAQLLRQELEQPGDRHPTALQLDYLTQIEASCLRAASRIEETLDLAKASAPRSLSPVNLSSVVQQVVQDLQVQIQEGGVDVVVHPLADIMANPTATYQIVLNLISNAVQFRSSDRPRVDVRAVPVLGRVELSIADNGTGFDPELSNQIFQSFYRLSTTTSGTGIGLAVVKRLAEGCRAQLRVETEEGVGSIFTVSFEDTGLPAQVDRCLDAPGNPLTVTVSSN